MILLWYFLTLVFGVIGFVAVFRIFEILILGAGVFPTTQLLIAFITLLLAFLCLRKARRVT
ncbi:MAG TPA: hypothetical protein DC047_05585 [Blastocatellia bacterium]|jgi:hypothetical protein|nr:hypothetical protein [Blastocatellia bacterium]